MVARIFWFGRAACAAVVCVSVVSGASADTFGTGGNQFTIDLVTISGDASSANGTNISQHAPGEEGYKTFADPGDAYRMGVYEITNDEWNKFKNSVGLPVTGSPLDAYDESPYWIGTNVPTNNVSWYEAAQFVNWLNTSTGHPVAYKFTGTQGQSNYALDTWSAAEADNGTNLYRHKDAFYYLPTEDEWVKAGYWNGTGLQTYATKPGDSLHQGDGVSGTGWNYYDNGYATDPYGPWDVGSGSEELNGTFDMMGNVWEWVESPYNDTIYGVGSPRTLRGSCICDEELPCDGIRSNNRLTGVLIESNDVGFRVASEVPEPCSLVLVSLGGLALLRRRRGLASERL